MFDKDLITSPPGSQRGLSDQELQKLWVKRPADLASASGPAQRWELEQAESFSNVSNAIKCTYSGILLAGAAFGATLVIIPIMISFVSAIVSLRFPMFEHLLYLSFWAFICGLIGLFVAVISGGLSVCLVLFLNWTLRGLLTRRSAIILTGALAGFIPSGAFLFSGGGQPLFLLFEPGAGLWLHGLVFFLIFTFVAMLFGQVGALWGANSDGVWRNLKQELEFQQLQRAQQENANGESVSSGKGAQAKFQFRIQHLMIGMILCSLVLALDQFSVRHSLLVALVLYALMQSLLFLVDWLYFRRYRKKLLGA